MMRTQFLPRRPWFRQLSNQVRARFQIVAERLFLGPVFVTAAIHAALIGLYLLASGGDVSALVCANAEQIGQWPYEQIRVGFAAGGFDGQYYYTLARDPWRTYDSTFIDLPPLRHARILYPALAWALSGGDSVRLLWVLPAINLFAIVGIGWFGARLSVHFGRSAWWGVLLPIALNTGMSALRNLTDPLATLTICGLLTAWLLRWPVWQLVAWAIAAILSREQNVAIVSIVLLETLLVGCRSRAAGLAGALLVGLGWMVGLRAMYGAWPTAPDNLSPPFVGMWHRWTHLEGLSGGRSKLIHIAGMMLLSFQIGASLALVFFRAHRMPILIAMAGASLAVMGGTGIFLNGWSYSRVFLWMPLGIWLWSLASNRNWPAIFLTASLLWPMAAIAQAWVR